MAVHSMLELKMMVWQKSFFDYKSAGLFALTTLFTLKALVCSKRTSLSEPDSSPSDFIRRCTSSKGGTLF
eukprot:14059178-Ditylum_brightwellii.AAC.2